MSKNWNLNAGNLYPEVHISPGSLKSSSLQSSPVGPSVSGMPSRSMLDKIKYIETDRAPYVIDIYPESDGRLNSVLGTNLGA